MCSGCSLTQPWPHLLPLSPLLSPLELHFLPRPSFNKPGTPLPQALCTCCTLCLEWPSLECPHGLLPLLYPLLCLNIILKEKLTRPDNQKHKPLLPTSITLYPFSYFIPYHYLYHLSEKYICLLLCFGFSMPLEFKLYEFQQFVFWGGRRRSNAKV